MPAKASSQNLLLTGIVIAAVAGVLLGHLAPGTAVRLKFLGEIFLRALFMMVVPLVIVSMISGITQLGDIRKLGTLGTRTLIYYLATTAIAVIIGMVLVNWIQPGKGVERKRDEFPDAPYQIRPAPLRGGSNLVLLDPRDRFSVTAYGPGWRVELLDQDALGKVDPEAKSSERELPVLTWTDQQGQKIEPAAAGRGLRVRMQERRYSFGQVLEGLVPRNLFAAMMEDNLLGLIFFSLLFGAVLSTLGAPGRPVIEFIQGLNEAILRFVRLLMFFAPLGILGLVAARLGQAELSLPGGFLGELARVMKYALTVILGLLLHSLIVLPLLLRLLAGRPIAGYLRNLVPALVTAFSTASSSATLPLTMEGVAKNRVSDRVAKFVLPLGATVNMNGTALYEAVAAIFIAQVYQVPLDFSTQLIIFLTATLAAIGAAGIPEAGLVTMVIVLKAAHLPVDGIAAILAIDWFLDRCRTTVNVWGDMVGAAVVDRLEAGR